MIQKKLSRKDPSFQALMDYIREKKVAPPILYNLLSRDSKEVVKEFENNARLVKKRKNGNYLYHEVLSFHQKDSRKLKYHIFEDLTLKYLDLRTRGKGLAYAVIHWTDNPHVHIMLAANEFGSSRKKSLNFTNGQFGSLRREVELYQKKEYPFLEYSLIFDRPERKRGFKKTTGEQERDRRLKKEGKKEPSEKEQVYELVKTTLETAASEKEFKGKLKSAGWEFYRRGKHVGLKKLQSDVKNKKARRFRLKTLGLGELYEKSLEYWQRKPEMEKLMENIESDRLKQLVAEMGFKRDVSDLLEFGKSDFQKEFLKALTASR